MESFEERLYKHYIYTDTLRNIAVDIVSEVNNNFGKIVLERDQYINGKYLTLEILDMDLEDEIKEFIENMITITDPNYYTLEYSFEDKKVKINLKI